MPYIVVDFDRYIHTPILNDVFAKMIGDSGAEFADVEDAAGALMRIVSDEKVVGRAFAIVPRTWKNAPNGYVDLDQDDFEDGSFMGDAQFAVFKPFRMAPSLANGSNV